MNARDAVAVAAGRLATMIGPRTMRRIARLHRRITNPIVGRLAPYWRHMAVIEHTGRRSGRIYRTPVMAFVDRGTITVVVNYGRQSDWLRNIQAGTPTVVIHNRRRYRLADPHLVTISAGTHGLPDAVRRIRTPSDKALQGTLIPA
jgi:deazaflavin-dependent oxidoreductase (nitroreductase family)